jgi:hypothetical protein
MYLTIGNTTPAYTSGVIYNSSTGKYHLFDPHSRDPCTGLRSTEGVAVVTCHQTAEDLGKFTMALSQSLELNEPVMFELTPVNAEYIVHDFDGFSMSEGEYDCRMTILEENQNKLSQIDNTCMSDDGDDNSSPDEFEDEVTSSDLDIDAASSDENYIPNKKGNFHTSVLKLQLI